MKVLVIHLVSRIIACHGKASRAGLDQKAVYLTRERASFSFMWGQKSSGVFSSSLGGEVGVDKLKDHRPKLTLLNRKPECFGRPFLM